MSRTEGARLFRESWIAGVRRHFPGEPKAGYVTPWDGTPQWEREAAGAVYEQVRQFLAVSGGQAARLSREQKGRFVALRPMPTSSRPSRPLTPCGERWFCSAVCWVAGRTTRSVSRVTGVIHELR